MRKQAEKLLALACEHPPRTALLFFSSLTRVMCPLQNEMFSLKYLGSRGCGFKTCTSWKLLAPFESLNYIYLHPFCIYNARFGFCAKNNKRIIGREKLITDAFRRVGSFFVVFVHPSASLLITFAGCRIPQTLPHTYLCLSPNIVDEQLMAVECS